MKTLVRIYILIPLLTLISCTYNLPPDQNSRTLDGNVQNGQSPKNLNSLRKALIASDYNRTQEYALLRSQLDSNTQVIQIKITRMQDSLVQVNQKLETRAIQIEKKLNDMQAIMYVLLGGVLILMIFLFFRLPSRNKMVR